MEREANGSDSFPCKNTHLIFTNYKINGPSYVKEDILHIAVEY